MLLTELIAQAAGFDALPPGDKIRLFAWYLHTHAGVATFDNADMRRCFREVGAVAPDVTVYLPRMAEKKPPDLIMVRGKYQLERSVRAALDKKYGQHPVTIAVAKLLSDLPAKLPDVAERVFLQEAIDCYRVRAFRAAIVMTWNLAFDHLLRWALADPKRLAAFNAAIPVRYSKKKGIIVTHIDDFEDLKESETIEICNTANLLSKNTVTVLQEKLKRRNIAAHPSQAVIAQSQADDAITDLVNNVVLALR
jgi:hypothetical protein